MELRQIRHFVALVEEKTFALAARRVCISQPALSRSLRTLETYLGVRLIERGPRRSVPTAAGERFLPHARDILANCERARTAVEHVDTSRSMSLSIGIAAPLTSWLSARIATNLGLEMPGVELYLREASAEALMDPIREGRMAFAVAILSAGGPDPRIVVEHVAPLNSVVVSAKRHERRPIAPLLIRPCPPSRWVTLNGLDDHTTLHHHFIRRGLDRPWITLTESTTRLRSLVLDEGYLALVPPQFLHLELRCDDLEIHEVDIPKAARAVGLLYSPDTPRSASIERAKAIVRRCCVETQAAKLPDRLSLPLPAGIALHA